jgi:hypothetical protein
LRSVCAHGGKRASVHTASQAHTHRNHAHGQALDPSILSAASTVQPSSQMAPVRCRTGEPSSAAAAAATRNTTGDCASLAAPSGPLAPAPALSLPAGSGAVGMLVSPPLHGRRSQQALARRLLQMPHALPTPAAGVATAAQQRCRAARDLAPGTWRLRGASAGAPHCSRSRAALCIVTGPTLPHAPSTRPSHGT